jgi:hypothetical protein
VERHVAQPVPPEVYRRRRAGVVLALALVALAVIGILVLASGGDDDNPATVAVPNVVGLNVADATRALSDAGLRSQVTEREGPTPADQVADQDPDAGATVSRGTTVTLFVPRPAATTTTPTTARTATTAAPTTQATTPATTAAPATTQPPTTAAPTTALPPPTTSIVVPTTSAITTTRL